MVYLRDGSVPQGGYGGLAGDLRDAGQARVQAVSGRQFPVLRRCVVAAPELDLGAGGGR